MAVSLTRINSDSQSPHTSTIHPHYSDLEDDSGSEDGLDPGWESNTDFEDGSFGDEEQVEIGLGQGQSRWKIDHRSGAHRLRPRDFINMAQSSSFNGARAVDMLHTAYTIDFGSRKAGSRPAGPRDRVFCYFHLDLLILIGRPLQPLTKPSPRLFDSATVSFKNWRAPYSTKHLHGTLLDVEHRTFRIASVGRDSWYIVMHPIANLPTELPTQQERRKRLERSSQASALQLHHAQFLATYIKSIFLSAELMDEGIEPSWRLDASESSRIALNKWTLFQETFMREWTSYVQHNACDDFWLQNQPAFHAYDYGANVEIEAHDEIRSLPVLTRLRANEEHSSDDEMHSDDEDSRSSTPMNAEGGEADIHAEPHDAGLDSLRTELEAKYILDNIETVSYALAVDIDCEEDGQEDGQDDDSEGEEERPKRCLLADRNKVLEAFNGDVNRFTFYPLAFHPAYGNFSAPRPPSFLEDHVTAVMEDNMSFQNNGEKVLAFAHFQAYSNVKRSIRHGPGDLLATKGTATAALALPESEARYSTHMLRKREGLLRRMKGEVTPDNPESSKPFARERQRIRASMDTGMYPFRMEQVVSLRASRLVDTRRNFITILSPIFQLMRFYLDKPDTYTALLHSFRPDTFPGVLVPFARTFELAIDHIRTAFEAAGSKKLPVASAEAVSALDRLGSYCFTGFPRSLMRTVLAPLGTLVSIEQGAWPYIDPTVLDIRNGSNLSLARWPRGRDGRPVLMHVASIAFHYGPAAAAARQNNVWFQEFGKAAIHGQGSAEAYLAALFRDRWIPEMVAFIMHQFKRGRNRRDSARRLSEEEQASVMRWSASEDPFSRRRYELIYPLFMRDAPSDVVKTPLRDFVRQLYRHCNQGTQQTFASRHATWFSVLRSTMQNTDVLVMDQDAWLGALAAAMIRSNIHYTPGHHRSKLSHRRVIEVTNAPPVPPTIWARPGTTKRAAIDAERNAKRLKRRSVIRFGCAIPFESIPDLVERGFDGAERTFQAGDRGILEHYQLARQTLTLWLGDPLCDLLLMLALTLASSSATPTVPQGKTGFHASDKPNKLPALFAATLVTKMLWFLVPAAFAWGEKGVAGIALTVPQMTKKLEHKGVSSRVLRELKWVYAKGKRDSPRNKDMQLRDREELLSMRREMVRSMEDAPRFVALVFGGDDIWIERCHSIVQEI